MQFATNESVRLAYEVEGDGAPLLLVHGLGYCREGWGPAASLLTERFRVIRFDNRGVGDSDAPRGPYSVRMLTADALAVLNAAQVERAHVLGVSLGGLVAQTLAVTAPERVDRLVLVGSTPGGIHSHGVPAASIRLMTEAPALEHDELLRRLVVNALSPTTVVERPGLVEEILAYRRRRSPRFGPWLAQAAAGAWFGLHGRRERIDAPTLVLHGADDHVMDPRNGELLAHGIPGAEHIVFEGSGHLVFWEEPQRFVAAVAAFCDGATLSRPLRRAV
ncbi:MAG: alpha/beta fold hydrolase [Gaiellaceae bacterium]